jgi:ribosomal protein L11 methyltransferase
MTQSLGAETVPRVAFLTPAMILSNVLFPAPFFPIRALKLGASEVVGTDLDPDCMTSTHENFEVNHLDSRLGTFYVGNLIDDVELQEKVGTEEYDIVVANILADVIIPMAPVIPARLKKGGYFITSGIIDFKEDQVKEAIEKAGLTVVEINHQGEWVNITAQKR